MRAAARGAAAAEWPCGRKGPGKETERMRSDEAGGPGRAPAELPRARAAAGRKGAGYLFYSIGVGAGLFPGRTGPETPAAALRPRALLFQAIW